MQLKQRISKIENGLILPGICECRKRGRIKQSIEAESLTDFFNQLFSGMCRICYKKHVSAGYTFADYSTESGNMIESAKKEKGAAWLESTDWAEYIRTETSENLQSVDAEMSVSASYNRLITKPCVVCGEPPVSAARGCEFEGMSPKCGLYCEQANEVIENAVKTAN